MTSSINSKTSQQLLQELDQVTRQLEKGLKDTLITRSAFKNIRNRYQKASKPIQYIPYMNEVLKRLESWQLAEKRFYRNLRKETLLTTKYFQVGGDCKKLVETLEKINKQ